MAINISLERRAEIGRERRERTRNKLLEAAARVIAARGEDNARIEDFINQAGVARGTFYNYFLTREELIDSLWTYLGKTPFQRIQDLCATLADPAERITAELRLVVAQAAADPTWGWLVYSMSGQRTVNDDLQSYPSTDLRAGMTAGRFHFEDFEVARDLVVSAARTALRVQLEGRGSASYVKGMCLVLLLALGLRQDEARDLSHRPPPSSD